MLFFVKTEVIDGKVDDLARKIVNHEFKPVEGNIVYCTHDGRFGFNLVDAKDEADVRSRFQSFDSYVRVTEVQRIEPMGQFMERWKAEHGMLGGQTQPTQEYPQI